MAERAEGEPAGRRATARSPKASARPERLGMCVPQGRGAPDRAARGAGARRRARGPVAGRATGGRRSRHHGRARGDRLPERERAAGDGVRVGGCGRCHRARGAAATLAASRSGRLASSGSAFAPSSATRPGEPWELRLDRPRDETERAGRARGRDRRRPDARLPIPGSPASRRRGRAARRLEPGPICASSRSRPSGSVAAAPVMPEP